MNNTADKKENQDVEEVTGELDLMELNDLYEKYILVIDKYYNSQTALAKSISKGFIDLATANFSSSTISVKKYGPDYYDNRVKAVKLAEWSDDNGFRLVNRSETSSKSEDHQHSEKNKDQDSEEAKLQKASKDENKAVLIKSQKTGNQEVEVSEKASTSANDQDNDSAGGTSFRDPLKMFGILVPQSLKDSQKAFIEALEEMIQLTNISNEVRTIEKLMERGTKASKSETDVPGK